MPPRWSSPSVLIPNPEHYQLQNADSSRKSYPGVADMDKAMHHDSQPEPRAVASVVSLFRRVTIAQLNYQIGAV